MSMTDQDRVAAQRLSAMTADDFATWFFRGFRALVAGNVEDRPFREIRSGPLLREDVTDDLAAVYADLDQATKDAFVQGLDATFRGLDVRKIDDQKALIFVLRLAAKIQHRPLLPFIARKLFAEQEGEPEETQRLRSVALDVAIELSAWSPNARQSLQNIVHSRLFRSSAAATILLALADASPEDLLDHLYRLENDVVQIYGEAAEPVDSSMMLRRARLLVELAEATDDSILGGVIEFALNNRSWRLAWLGNTLLNEAVVDRLAPSEAARVGQLLETVSTFTLEPLQEPEWVRQFLPPSATPGERKEDLETLTSDDIGSEAEETLFQSMVSRLLSSDHSFCHLSPEVRQLVLDDVDGKE